MADDVDKANHDAKQDTNGDNGLGGAKDEVDKLTKDDFEHASSDEKAQQLRDELDEDIDGAMEDINANRIKAADKKMRKIRDKLKVLKKAKQDPINAKLNAAAKFKRKITAAALPVVASMTFNDFLVALITPAVSDAISSAMEGFNAQTSSSETSAVASHQDIIELAGGLKSITETLQVNTTTLNSIAESLRTRPAG
jgi:hypothetical protein